MRLESAYVPIAEPSPWWLKGLAIFMAVLTAFMILGSISAIASPVIVDRLLPENYEEIEPFPEDGSSEEKAEWEENSVFWGELVEYYDEVMGLMEMQGFHSAILALVGLMCTITLWKGERELGVKLMGFWIVINFLGGAGLFWMFTRIGIMPDFATGDREVEMINTSLIENLTLVIGWGQLIFCNALLVAVLALVSAKSKPEIVFQE
tara:strand:- start:339 stop:959 length:621 start_codon:yes stop_codon:yes gene_type:complete